ncbi:hypothetical protein OL548_34175 (plasmid) [Lysinibacillus sp. MHQ-1]|nr:hypothetical protein OL548_34175 [Lysinibacillus sp. MHQ-1]
MISSKIKIRTKHFKANTVLELEIEKDDQHIAIKEVEKQGFKGTEIIF